MDKTGRSFEGRIAGLTRRLAAVIALAALLAPLGCAGIYQDPGPNPAKVRVKLDLAADLNRLPTGAVDVSRTPRWDWGLYLVGSDGRLTPLRPESGEELKLISGPRLTRETVFLAPPGRVRLRLLAEGYVLARYGMTAEPRVLTLLSQDYDLDLAPGAEVSLKPGQR